MTDFSGAAPALRPGDGGDQVRELQARLSALGLFEGAIDGHFGDLTAASVMRLQEQQHQAADGCVDEHTWAALALAEAVAGVGHVAAVAGDPAAGTESEDQQWVWDGSQWHPNDHAAEPVVAVAEPSAEHRSADGQWVWDGHQWQPVIA